MTKNLTRILVFSSTMLGIILRCRTNLAQSSSVIFHPNRMLRGFHNGWILGIGAMDHAASSQAR